jgi:prepilin-type N-terminal cleavage/methylation domain-containing protein
MNKTKSFHRGFTMIELLVVVTIMILLTMIGLVSYQSAMRKARNGKRAADIETVRSALVMYRSDNTQYPSTNSFSAMIGLVSDYMSTSTIEDPKNVAPHVYTYTSAGPTFTLCYTTEPSTDPGSNKCVSNP